MSFHKNEIGVLSINDGPISNKMDRRKPTIWDHITVAVAEYLGTTLLVFLACMGCTLGIQNTATQEISSMHISFTAGLAVTVAIQTFAHLSGAFVNPSVTMGALIMKQITWIQVPVYIIAQIAGSLSGSAFHWIVSNQDHLGSVGNGTGVCVNTINSAISTGQGLVVEIILSIIMNVAICASWDSKNADKQDSVSLRIGLLVVVLNLAAGAYTGASMNPARSFGPAVFNGMYQNHWIYWVGPTIGAVVSAFVYRALFLDRD